MSTHINSLLCLGDSYTVGESVPLHQSFPYQTVQLLRKAGLHFNAPEMIAQTNWTSFELADHIIKQLLSDSYNFVSLLIGVNNQFRGLSITDFAADFEFLLKKAIHFAGSKANHVIVLSIPDWSVTKFAVKHPNKNASKEIDDYNAVCAMLATKYHVQLIDITAETRLAKNDSSLLTGNGLHYSGKEYSIWAAKIAALIKKSV
ncbi:MAG: SGNH/GDSL hydrolase family protein [Chitinophagaceae bacterium]|nr:SGNH/GDSL hydrolase family protein [Chitinophagaceae bacterium]